ncbi:MAG TPA: MgtC/SapB family protein [Nitrococcus sp.]|nr:MgtC/SapB family protein [Nitrococcus sp.]
MQLVHTFAALAISLAVGLLIGLERGWEQRDEAEGQRVAGIRTFTLIGLLGGITALLAARYGAVILAFGFLGVAVISSTAYFVTARTSHQYGITSQGAFLATYALGAAAASGYPEAAAAAAVVIAIVLGFKEELHGWLQRLDRSELTAALQLLMITIVVLPILPNRNFGPLNAINPFRIWWFVVLIAGISFIGHFAIRIAGPGRGVLLTGVLGGLASSTALTVNFSRFGRGRPLAHPLLAIGIVLATGTVFLRVTTYVNVLNPTLGLHLLLPLISMALLSYAIALFAWWRERGTLVPPALQPSKPFQLRVALQFGLILALITLLSEATRRFLGEAGIYALAIITGLSGVDAFTLSLIYMAEEPLSNGVATKAILLAAASNSIMKAVLVGVLCGGPLARRIALYATALIAVTAVWIWSIPN